MYGIVILIFTLQACNLPNTNTPTSTVSGSPPETSIAVTAALQNQVVPVGLPAERSGHAGDFDSSLSAANQEATGGDRHTFGEFERPFNAQTMDKYFEQQDIVDTFVFQDDIWIYGQIMLRGQGSDETISSKYALELDVDIDGKGDFLVTASEPTSTEWTVEGVQVCKDQNKSVGNKTAMYTDKNATAGDGFEVCVFNAGEGQDPDSAWVRAAVDGTPTVEIAVKRSVLGNSDKYLIGMWAGTTLLDPALFDVNDHFTHEQAGAANRGYPLFYPIKEVYEAIIPAVWRLVLYPKEMSLASVRRGLKPVVKNVQRSLPPPSL